MSDLLSKDDLVRLLAAALGAEQSSRIVHEGIVRLGLTSDAITREQAVRLFEDLRAEPGLVGITARVAVARLNQGDLRSGPSAAASPEPATAPSPTRPRKPASMMVALLEPTLGSERAAAVVREALDTLKVGRGGLTVEEALGVLEHIAKSPGVEGVVARFAKTRVHLKWG